MVYKYTVEEVVSTRVQVEKTLKASQIYTCSDARVKIEQLLRSYCIIAFRPPKVNEGFIQASSGSCILRASIDFLSSDPRFIVEKLSFSDWWS